ncbi:autotransporter-associated beta strand protein [Bradyrhizobium sp. GM2.4]
MLTLSGTNTYAGGTTISAGTLQIGDGGTTGSVLGNITNNAALIFNRSDAVTFGSAIGGSGLVSKQGTGTLTLSGTNTYTGGTTVNAGELVVNGSIASSVLTAVSSGATLSGVGTVGNTVINTGGTLAAGNGAAGTSLNVTGSLALQSGAIYMVQINPTTSSFIGVTGSATLGGATVNATYANGSYVAKQYTILTAGSVSGTFGSVVETNLPTNFHTTLSYDPTHAYLNLVLNFVPPGGSLTGNQNGVGNAIVGYFNTNGGIPLVYSGLTPAGLTQASGETATGSQQTTFNAMTQFMSIMTDPFTPGRGDGVHAPAYAEDNVAANAYASSGKPRSKNERDAYAAIYSKAPLRSNYDPRWSVWAAGFGGAQTTDGNLAAGSNTSTSRIFGMAAGADYILSPNTVAGFALAGGGTSFSVVNGGSGRSDLFQAGAFVRHTIGAAYVSGALAYGWQDVTTDRTVTIAGVDRLRAQFNANAYSGRLEGGYRIVTPWIGGIGLTPYAGRAVHNVRPACLCRVRRLRHQHLCASLWLQERHGQQERTRHPRRQILGDAERDPHLARPCGLGARLQPGSRHQLRLPGAARRQLHRQRRKTGQRVRADDGVPPNEMDERLVCGRHLRGRVLRRHALLCRQGRGQIRLVRGVLPEAYGL